MVGIWQVKIGIGRSRELASCHFAPRRRRGCLERGVSIRGDVADLEKKGSTLVRGGKKVAGAAKWT